MATSVKQMMAEAGAAVPRITPAEVREMIAGGNAVLVDVRDAMEVRSTGKVAGALAYPVLMVIVIGLLVGVLMVAVVPKVTSIFENLGQALPWYTRLLIFVSDTLAGFWWLIIGLSVLGVYLFRRWKKTPALSLWPA